MCGAKLFKDLQPLNPAKTRPTRRSVESFAGMLFHNMEQVLAAVRKHGLLAADWQPEVPRREQRLMVLRAPEL
jgi:hypothetical protein